MSDSQQKPWSNNPNAPKISSGLHFEEKGSIIGNLVAPIFYGTSEASPPTRPHIRAHFVYFVCPRDDHRGFLEMYDRTV